MYLFSNLSDAFIDYKQFELILDTFNQGAARV
jgi:hypothetical protein